MSKSMRRSLSTLAILPVLLSLTLTAHGAIIRVKTSGADANDGSTWALAKKTVQAAINASASGDEVWVAAGTYVARITLKNGVGLYGGFAGTESTRSDRNWVTNISILDGNQGGSVVTGPSGLTSATVIDGFTIRNGKAQYGGGINSSGSPTITDNIITANTATCTTGQPCGGGIYCASAVVTFCTISNNSAVPPASACSSGGGVYCCDQATVSCCTISNNTASASGVYYGMGGGVYVGNNNARVSCNTISGNAATSSGSGVSFGGGVCGYGNLYSNLLMSNTAGNGGGLSMDGSFTTAVVVGNTIVGNTATATGAPGGINIGDGTVANNIVAFNSSGVKVITVHGCYESCNCVYNPAGSNFISCSAGTGDIQVDPLFVNRSAGDYHLADASLCISSGDNTRVPAGYNDLDGNARVFPTGGVVDMGCYEWDKYGIVVATPTSASSYFSATQTVDISGSAVDNTGCITGVTWSNDRGCSGTCSGTTAWSAVDVPLQPGLNNITATATDDAGHNFSVSLVVGYDATPAAVVIVVPTSASTLTTTAGRTACSGYVVSDIPIAKVRYALSTGLSNVCLGTTSWAIAGSGIGIAPGVSTLTVTATDVVGHECSKTLTMTRLPITIREAKGLSAYDPVYVTDAVVTAVDSANSVFSVESRDRSAGIDIEAWVATNPTVGQPVQLSGEIRLYNGTKRVGVGTFLKIDPVAALKPVTMSSRAIGNDLGENLHYLGIDTGGLLVRYFGKVKTTSTSPRFIYVDDGMGYQDGTAVANRGIRVCLPTTVSVPAANSYVMVTGVKGVKPTSTAAGGAYVNGVWYNGSVYIPTITIRDAADLIVL